MSQQAVDFVIERLLTDWDLRDRFGRDPLRALAHLHFSTDIELTPDEMRAFLRIDPEIWYPGWDGGGTPFH